MTMRHSLRINNCLEERGFIWHSGEKVSLSTTWPTWKENFNLEVMRNGEDDPESHEEMVSVIDEERVLHDNNKRSVVINNELDNGELRGSVSWLLTVGAGRRRWPKKHLG